MDGYNEKLRDGKAQLLVDKEKVEAMKQSEQETMKPGEEWKIDSDTQPAPDWVISQQKIVDKIKEDMKEEDESESIDGPMTIDNPTKVEYTPWHRTEALDLLKKQSKYKGMVDELSYDQITLDDLLNELYKHPIGSPLYATLRNCIVEKLTEPKYDDYVISFMSRMNISYLNERQKHDELEELNTITGIDKYPSMGGMINDKLASDMYFSNKLSFVEDSKFETMPRKYLEYNPEYKQLVVAGYITDGKDIMLLHANNNKDNRIQDKFTMIQGHVDFGPAAYTMTQEQFLRDNMLREFQEEIKFNGKLDFEITPKYLINDRRHHVGLEHFGIIYEIKVTNLEEFRGMVSSGEADKHSVAVIKRGTFDKFYDNFDDWTKLLFDEMNGYR